MDEYELYESGMSIPEVSEKTGIAQSTLRSRFKARNILRSRADAIRISAKNGKLGGGTRGKKREMTSEWKENLRKAALNRGDRDAKGISLKPSGYIEHTRGEHKGKMQHIVIMQEYIGRQLNVDECVHHINGNKQDNRIENLKLMKKKDHERLHGLSREHSRDEKGRFS